MLAVLKDQLAALLAIEPARISHSLAAEMTDPSSQPSSWITRWIDCSNSRGFGYELCDDSFGAMYNDGTRLTMLADKHNIRYVDRDGKEFYYTVNGYPYEIEEKLNIARRFLDYMNVHLEKTRCTIDADRLIAATPINWSGSMSRVPYMHQWIRTQNSIVMQLSNGSVQINFTDHTKIIMCPIMAAVTYIDKSKNFMTFRFETIQRNGCPRILAKNLEDACEKIDALITKSSDNILTRSHSVPCLFMA